MRARRPDAPRPRAFVAAGRQPRGPGQRRPPAVREGLRGHRRARARSRRFAPGPTRSVSTSCPERRGRSTIDEAAALARVIRDAAPLGRSAPGRRRGRRPAGRAPGGADRGDRPRRRSSSTAASRWRRRRDRPRPAWKAIHVPAEVPTTAAAGARRGGPCLPRRRGRAPDPGRHGRRPASRRHRRHAPTPTVVGRDRPRGAGRRWPAG